MDLNFKVLGAGEPLVFLHGLFGMLDNWQSVAKRFADKESEAGRMAVLVDQRNHGKSPHTDTTSYPEMAADLAAFLSSQWMHKVDLLGHSMGGKTAMQYALSYPDRVRKLIVVDMAPKAFPRGHDTIFAAMRAIPLDTDMSRGEIDELLATTIPEPGVRLFLMKNLRREPTGGYSWKLNLDTVEAFYEQILQPVSGLPWDGEALFVRGERSGYVRDEDWPAVLELFPRAELATIAGAGHWVHAEAPDELYELVSGFLER